MPKRPAKIMKGLEYKRSFKIGDSWNTFTVKSDITIDIEFESKKDLEAKCDSLYSTVLDQVEKQFKKAVNRFGSVNI